MGFWAVLCYRFMAYLELKKSRMQQQVATEKSTKLGHNLRSGIAAKGIAINDLDKNNDKEEELSIQFNIKNARFLIQYLYLTNSLYIQDGLIISFQ